MASKPDASLSLGRLLYRAHVQYQSSIGGSTVEKPAETPTSIGLASHLVRAPPDRLTWSCDNVGVTTVERPDPKSLSTFSQCTEFPPHRGFELMSSRSRVRLYVTKWLACRMLVLVSEGFSTVPMCSSKAVLEGVLKRSLLRLRLALG